MERRLLLPKIIVSDYTITPPISTSYHAIKPFHPQKEDTIFFGQTYKLIKSLLMPPRCPHDPNKRRWPCEFCGIVATRAYWTCAALLLDYYADFYAHDSAIMQSIWFHLFDIWQESAVWLIDGLILESQCVGVSEAYRARNAAKAQAFVKNVRDTVELVEVVLWGRKQSINTAAAAHPTQDTILYDPRGEVWRSSGEYDTGPWISGVKPWCQFLYNGGPGVVPPPLPPTFACQKTNDHNNNNNNNTDGKVIIKTTRYIPHPAIAILTAHTRRARALARKYYSSSSSSPETTLRRLNEFDAYTPIFPSPRHPVHTFTSPLTGHTVSYALGNGAPPVLRHVGFADPELVEEPADWSLLDDCVAICKGLEPYLGISRTMGAGGGPVDEAAFDVWTVVETWEKGGGEGRKEDEDEEGKKVVELGDMFENWCGIRECEVGFSRSGR
ncbi:hypothetical protein COCMIDRAFT_89328 [Bipolaris oryzae ATCC 44560]|uniref:Uncharacterized protein n=1 Tax=Bipolaris oryzae ATCC 44560 TaxID=930090 RepID=W6Z7P9_COCMI|nr:uncharacterized protein COCMIDRAFT_89328 [Bipolaris oryzae ATCC 44560]EUC47742.1 hypothetical protein COCMIDRAFT_89328 [Bipolaris oryzae ATCC 44560]